MRGEIGVESEAGRGATFWFQIPLAEAAGAPVIARQHLPGKLRGVRALVVDDIAMNSEILSHQLHAAGMEVGTASDGFAALAEMERAWHCAQPYDIAFLDQMMPGL